jgi:molybdate transport system regulatory protein
VAQKKKRKNAGLGSGPRLGGCRLSGRLWVEKDGATLLSWGRVALLERIREHGSISAAARSMGMGYRHAWELVDEMNRLGPRKLVEKSVGGVGGGGASLTPAGEAALRSFWRVVARFREWLAREDPRLWRGQSVRRACLAGKGRR